MTLCKFRHVSLSAKHLKNYWSWSLETWRMDLYWWVDDMIMPPISKEIDGASYFAFVRSFAVRPSVRPFVYSLRFFVHAIS